METKQKVAEMNAFPVEIRVNGDELSITETRWAYRQSLEAIMFEYSITRKDAKRVKRRVIDMLRYWEPETLEESDR